MFIKLAEREKRELLRIKQKGETETVRDRAHAILLRGNRFTVEDASKALLRSDKFVKNATKLYRQGKLKEIHFSGNNHKLLKKQRKEIIEIIKTKTPQDLKGFKFKEQFWTTDILRTVLKRKYKVEYKTEKSYYDLFKQAGFTFHKPKTKDYRQDPEKIKKFKGALKKSLTTTKIRLSW